MRKVFINLTFRGFLTITLKFIIMQRNINNDQNSTKSQIITEVTINYSLSFEPPVDFS
jgi:hypothetical protein